MALIHCFSSFILALFPRIAARGDCRGYCLALAIEGEVAAEHYLYPAGGWGDVWRTIFMVIGLGKRLFLTIADVVHSLVIIQTVTNNEIMFSLHGVYVTTGKCGTFARVVAAFPTVDVKLSAEVMGY